MGFNPDKPYNELPPLPPKKDLETPAVLKKAINPARALAELRGMGKTIPNQNILINSLTLQEAKDSSAIENVITTNDALFKAFSAQSSQIDPATKEVLHYREALWEGFNSLKRKGLLTTNLFIRLVQTIKENQAGIRNTLGTKIVNRKNNKVLYTPPEGENLVRDKLKNLESYIHDKKGIDPLIKLAIIHYQFEAIHPFSDGNGRTGRIINILYLILQGLLDLPVLYLSKYIIEHKSDYYKLLGAVTEKQEWQPWIVFILNAVEDTANFTRQRILDIRDLLDETVRRAKSELPEWMYSKDLIELLFHQPYCKAETLINAGIVKRRTAAKYLRELESVGILKGQKIGRENLYLNVKLYDLLSR